MIYCRTCNSVIENPEVSCGRCQNGFVSRLVCSLCDTVLPSGVGVCHCQAQYRQPSRGDQTTGSQELLAIIPALPSRGVMRPPVLPMGLPARVPETYQAGRHGAMAEVVLNGNDATILTEMGQAAALLTLLAARMNELQGHMASTRQVIKECRKLSLELQEEVEIRLGPQGPVG